MGGMERELSVWSEREARQEAEIKDKMYNKFTHSASHSPLYSCSALAHCVSGPALYSFLAPYFNSKTGFTVVVLCKSNLFVMCDWQISEVQTDSNRTENCK